MIHEAINALVAVIHERGVYSSEYIKNKAEICVDFSKIILSGDKNIKSIYYAALLHDIGMIYIPENIHKKPDSLNPHERKILEGHPIISERIVGNLSVLKSSLSIIRHHHEHYDGSGYPDGIKGDQIPMGSRIISIVDNYKALISPRSYRQSCDPEEALEKMFHAGNHFDKTLLSSFSTFIKPRKGLKKSAKNALWNIAKTIVINIQNKQIDLPVFPDIVHKIRDVINNPEATSDEIADIIMKDSALTLKIISTANSSIYQSKIKIQTVREAITRLGVREVQNIIMTLSHKNLFDTHTHRFSDLIKQLWRHSLSSAFAAKLIAEHLKLKNYDRYFSISLMHDSGKVLFLISLENYLSGSQKMNRENLLSSISEVNSSLTGFLLRYWKFPRDFIRGATMHEGIQISKFSGKSILITNLADTISGISGFDLIKKNTDTDLPESAKLLDLDQNDLNRISFQLKTIMEKSI